MAERTDKHPARSLKGLQGHAGDPSGRSEPAATLPATPAGAEEVPCAGSGRQSSSSARGTDGTTTLGPPPRGALSGAAPSPFAPWAAAAQPGRGAAQGPTGAVVLRPRRCAVRRLRGLQLPACLGAGARTRSPRPAAALGSGAVYVGAGGRAAGMGGGGE